MVGGIGCFVPGCSNLVIGQCGGYQGHCAQFYCRDHSLGKLCYECGTRKVREEVRQAAQVAAKRTHDECLAVAEKITKKPGISIFFAVACLAGVAFILAQFPLDTPESGIAALLLVLAIPFTLYALLKFVLAKRSLAKAEKSKAGFRAFYEAYKSQEEKAMAEWRRENRKRLRQLSLDTGLSLQKLGHEAWNRLLESRGLEPLEAVAANVPSGRTRRG